ncbi:MAG: glycosyltransferase family 2 protein [Planctomycetes bacterium]|nr:glycosyltransferase family 2 protein [Planctomycetota bacterium]
MSAPVKLSLLTPCYNEEENVQPLVEECFAALQKFGVPFEMIAIDDGSTDGTLRRLLALRRERPELRIIHLKERRGQSAALLAGFRAACGEFIGTIDADLQNDPADLMVLFGPVERGECDLASGWRKKRGDSWLRKISTRIANGIRKRFLQDGMNDSAAPMKVYRREVPQRFPTFNGMHRFYPALAVLQGFRVLEIPVNHRPRGRGQSKYGVWNRVFRATLDMFGVAWLRKRAIRYEAEEL